MRLICPNCNAQYEVDAAMLPPEGRDVQCSACGEIWFQPGATPTPEAPFITDESPKAAPDDPVEDAAAAEWKATWDRTTKGRLHEAPLEDAMDADIDGIDDLAEKDVVQQDLAEAVQPDDAKLELDPDLPMPDAPPSPQNAPLGQDWDDQDLEDFVAATRVTPAPEPEPLADTAPMPPRDRRLPPLAERTSGDASAIAAAAAMARAAVDAMMAAPVAPQTPAPQDPRIAAQLAPDAEEPPLSDRLAVFDVQNQEAAGLEYAYDPEEDAPPLPRSDAVRAPVDEGGIPSLAPSRVTRGRRPVPQLPPEEDEDDEPLPPFEPFDAEPIPRPKLDDDKLALLREEAERETRARAAEAARLSATPRQTSADLGLPDVEPPVRLHIGPRVGPAAGETPPAPSMAQKPKGPRRELLPDIERINKTLEVSEATRSGRGGPRSPEAERKARMAGFRLGFAAALILAIGAALAYQQADRISARLPQAQPVLSHYVGLVDTARLSVDRLVRDALAEGQR